MVGRTEASSQLAVTSSQSAVGSRRSAVRSRTNVGCAARTTRQRSAERGSLNAQRGQSIPTQAAARPSFVIHHSAFDEADAPRGRGSDYCLPATDNAPQQRRGVILLVVMVLLALFTMMLLAFVVATISSRQGVTYSSRVEQTGDPPATLLHDAFLQAVRGPRNNLSIMGPHSLLEDIYGQGTLGTIDAAAPVQITNGALKSPIYTFSSSDFPAANGNSTAYGYYAGLVITMLSGPAAGRSSRVVGYNYDTTASTNKFQIQGFDGLVQPNGGDRFLINGRPFSGTGFGYRPGSFITGGANPPTRLLDAVDFSGPVAPNWSNAASQPGFQYALLPNPRRGVFAPSAGYTDPAGPGGANEDNDAVDFQNMLLAMRVWSPTLGTLVTPLPSLHRPDLIYYWNNRWKTQPLLSPGPQFLVDDANSTTAAIALPARNLLRKIVLRPLQLPDDPSTPVDESENPNFTGSNPNSSYSTNPLFLINGPWDVDNDGDGVTDSVWVDLGMPVQTAPDGRRYKPLFAILCIDMDGKLNLNAHTSWRHVPSTTSASRFTQVFAPFALPYGATAIASYPLQVGSGYGPAEISLHPLFEPVFQFNPGPTNLIPTGELRRLLGGDTTNLIDGRYGEVKIHAALGSLPGPGISGIDDALNWVRELDIPQIRNFGSGNFPQHQYPYLPIQLGGGPPAIQIPFQVDNTMWLSGKWLKPSGYRCPPDLDGDGMVALDPRGQPLYIDYPATTNLNVAGDAGWGEPDESIDDAYEMDHSLNAPGAYSNYLPYPNFATNYLAFHSLANSVSSDAPFSAAELERILRPYDWDTSTLPDRLIRLAPNAFTSTDPLVANNPGITGRFPYVPELRQMPNLLTTHSFDLPSPSMVITSPDLVTKLPNSVPSPNGHITQLVAGRINLDPLWAATTTTPPSGNNMGIAISQLVSSDLIGGEKMNLNRPMGNGQDDNSNGVVDEPGEVEFGWKALDSTGTGVQFDLDNDGNPDGYNPAGGSWGDKNGDGVLDGSDAPGMLARQLLARHLYLLMMLLADNQAGVGLLQIQMDCDGNGTPGQPADTAYYFAQWAINIVDFCDGDSIMTPFEFDINPFFDDDGNLNNGTWDVDGIISPTSHPSLSVDDQYAVPTGTSGKSGAPFRGLVWGCERPELLITETAATHDRRTSDTAYGSGSDGKNKVGGTPPDDDFDQVRRPQGTLIVELFNPNQPFTVGNKFAGQAPSELYTQAFPDPVTGSAQFGVNLAKVDLQTNTWPVWRLAIFKPTGSGVTARTSARMPTLLPNQIDRVVYFIPNTNPVPATEFTGLTVRQLYAQAGYNAVVPPNSYAVVGPAAVDPFDTSNTNLMTHFGKRDTSGDGPTGTPAAPTKNSYPYRLTVAPNVYIDGSTAGAAYIAFTQPPPAAVAPLKYAIPYSTMTDMKQVVSIPIQTLIGLPALPSDALNRPRSLRMSVSEPNAGYPIYPNAQLLPSGATADENAFYKQSDPVNLIPDMPYDLDTNAFATDAFRQVVLLTDGTTAPNPAYTTVFLQRLANPLAPWDLYANPYIIVDQLEVDLTTYNSENFSNVTDPSLTSTTAPSFDTRRRGVANPLTYGQNVFLPTSVPAKNTTVGTILNPFPFASFGFLNQELSPLDSQTSPTKWWLTSGTAVVPTAGATGIVAGEYRGDPTRPFPWLNWNDRPYVSSKELMLVPLGSPSSMLREMTLGGGIIPWPTNGNPYQAGTGLLPSPPVPMGEFGHLPNVFHSPLYLPGNTTPLPRQEYSPNFYRLLEYVHVPSRFAGTETWLPSGPMSGNPTMAGFLPIHLLHPPFNRVSRFRDPGRLNINTIFDPFVFQGLIDKFAAPQQSTPTWTNLWTLVSNSRLGTGGTATYSSAVPYLVTSVPSIMGTTPTTPSIFNAPFRSYGGHTLVPLDTMRREGTASAPSPEREIDGTLLRTFPGSPSYPLLEYPGAGPFAWPEINLADATPFPLDDQTRNPYFTYRAFHRMENSLTTRSNVYAMWITVGYFEVSPAPTADPQRNVKYPDGWMLGQEVGSDTGDIKRNRAFFMYDRTIPVGFERGENHNVEKGILLEHMIE